METTVINLYGSPCSGKSTIASGLFYKMKLAGFNVELASEWIKGKVYEEAPYPFTDQLYTFANQNKIIRQMVGKVDYVICDSPLLQTCIYQTREPKIYNQMAYEYYSLYRNIDVVLKRNHEFRQEGRIHTEAQSVVIDEKIKEFLQELSVDYTMVSSSNALDVVYKMVNEDFYEQQHK